MNYIGHLDTEQKKTGPVIWRKYEFLQIDNGAKVGKGTGFSSTDWWNVWLLVQD